MSLCSQVINQSAPGIFVMTNSKSTGYRFSKRTVALLYPDYYNFIILVRIQQYPHNSI